MNRPDLESTIITSEEARAFLRMVTKGFYSQSYTGLWIYEVIGREWDELRAWAEGLRDEINPQTCTWSVGIWEWVYGIEPDETLDLEFRRQRILSKIKAVRPINPETIRRAVAVLIGASVEAVEVNDFVAPYRFEIVVHPQETPFPYNRVAPYVREIKPSHLAFDVTVETKIEIQVLIETTYNLIGFGLTGQYNAGTRPNRNVKAQLYDIIVDAEIETKGASIPTQDTGATYATAPGTDPQRMPTPSVIFRQDSAEIDALITAKGFQATAPLTTESQNETGRYPHTQYAGRMEDTTILAETETKAAKYTHTPAGTVPETQHRFAQSAAEIRAAVEGAGYSFQADPAGTNPQDAIKLRIEAVAVEAEVEGAGFHVPHAATAQDGVSTGTIPGPQTKLGKSGGGIIPIITTDCFTFHYPMCGTQITKSNR